MPLEPTEFAPCPNCLHEVPVERLCEHDDAVTGPLCLDMCCEISHPVGLPIWKVSAA